MNPLVKNYVRRAQEIIGERTAGEIAYDTSVVEGLSIGMDIMLAVDAANRKYPAEALRPNQDQWEDVAARYDYIRQYYKNLKRMRIDP